MIIELGTGTDAKGNPTSKQIETTVVIQGKEYDALQALPFTVGDWRKLKSQHRIDIVQIQGQIELDTMCNLVLALFTKLVPGAKLADVEAVVPLMRLSDLVSLIVQGEKIDRPTSTSSTS